MKLAVGIDVHKEKCVAHVTHCGLNEPKPKQKEFLDRINEEFRRFPSDVRGLTDLARALKGHEIHILIENSTKSHDAYWILKGLDLDVTVAHATDLKQITMSQRKNDDNDAYKLAHYMRRRMLGEVEFHESHIPSRDVLIRRELCRMMLDDKCDLTKVKRQIRAHLLIRGVRLSKDYKDVCCINALRELKESRDVILMLDAKRAETLKERILFQEKTLRHAFADDSVFQSVYSIPGFGILSAAYVSCMGDDFSRFPDGRMYAASIGVIPKQDESADKGRECGITRRGDAELRRLLCQATFVHVNNADSFITDKYRRLKAAGKKHNEVLVACANSMARLIYKLASKGLMYEGDPEILNKCRTLDNGDVEDQMEEFSRKG